jgi:hypothetical protein
LACIFAEAHGIRKLDTPGERQMSRLRRSKYRNAEEAT